MIRRGVSIIEAVACVAIVGGLAIAIINTVGSIGRARVSAGERADGQMLAADLLAEVTSRRYAEDLAAKVQALGPEADETLAADRSSFDDVDDYAGLVDPSADGGVPRTREGADVPGVGSGWVRRVDVARVSPADLSPSVTDHGLLLVTVTVERGGRMIARLSAVRARAAEEAPR
jgi:hypothetical protein